MPCMTKLKFLVKRRILKTLRQEITAITLDEVTFSLEHCVLTDCKTVYEKKKKVMKLHKQRNSY